MENLRTTATTRLALARATRLSRPGLCVLINAMANGLKDGNQSI
jgi:hypothetical protein